MKRITLFSMVNCPHCQTAKQYLTKNNINFRLVNVKTASGQKEFAKSGYRSVPVVKVGDQFLNGFNVVNFKQLYNA